MVHTNSPKSSQIVAVSDCELKMESGRCIYYVAPSHVNPITEIYAETTSSMDSDLSQLKRKRSSYDSSDPADDWEGVNALCQALDAVLQQESNEIVNGKNVLEIGFCTGLPSVFALHNGASHVTLYCSDESMLGLCVEPTLERNNVKNSQRRFITGDFENIKKESNQKEYDVILATELLNTDHLLFEQLHDIIDYALAPDGVCLLTARMCYFNCDGSLPEFLDLIKSKGKFEAYTRWVSPKSDVVQRKVIQLTRTIR